MALALNSLGVWGGNSGSTATWPSNNSGSDPRTRTSGSVAPTSGAMVVAVCGWTIGSGNTDTTLTGYTITDSVGLTWTEQLADKTMEGALPGSGGTYGSVVKVFTAVSAGSSMTVTMRDTAAMGATTPANEAVLQLYEITGGVGAVTNATKVPATIGGTGIDEAASSNYVLTLGTAPAASSIVLAGRSAMTAGAGNMAADPGSGWTELYDTNQSGLMANQNMYRTGSTSTSVTWADLSVSETIYANTGQVWALEFVEGVVRTAHTDAHQTGSSSANLTTSSFTPADNSLLVAIVGQQRNGGGGGDMIGGITITDSAGLTWTRQCATNNPNDDYDTGWAIYTAPVTTGASMTVTTGNSSFTTQGKNVWIYGYTSGAGRPAPGANVATPFGTGVASRSTNLSAAPAVSSDVLGSLYNEGSTPTPSGFTSLYSGTTEYMTNLIYARSGSTSTLIDFGSFDAPFACTATALEIELPSAAVPSRSFTTLFCG